MVGTPYYIAPEIVRLSYDSNCKSYDNKCDVWSAGVVLYIMLSGHPPFDGSTNREIMQKIAKGDISYKDPIWRTISADGMSLLQLMLCYNEKVRPSSFDVLKHQWFKK